MSGLLRERTLALAGLFQAVRLVQDVARKGALDAIAFESSIKSVLKTDAATTEEVYGSVPMDLRLGLQTLFVLFQGNRKRVEDVETMRYMISLMVLEKKLLANRKALEKISIGLERVQHQAEHFSVTHSNVISQLADLYANTVSMIGPRIMISGDAANLQNPDNAARIRALLLAGIRSAVLWRQKGGRRWQIVLSRKKFVDMAGKILSEV